MIIEKIKAVRFMLLKQQEIERLVYVTKPYFTLEDAINLFRFHDEVKFQQIWNAFTNCYKSNDVYPGLGEPFFCWLYCRECNTCPYKDIHRYCNESNSDYNLLLKSRKDWELIFNKKFYNHLIIKSNNIPSKKILQEYLKEYEKNINILINGEIYLFEEKDYNIINEWLDVVADAVLVGLCNQVFIKRSAELLPFCIHLHHVIFNETRNVTDICRKYCKYFCFNRQRVKYDTQKHNQLMQQSLFNLLAL